LGCYSDDHDARFRRKHMPSRCACRQPPNAEGERKPCPTSGSKAVKLVASSVTTADGWTAVYSEESAERGIESATRSCLY